jgi:hypothetical protein
MKRRELLATALKSIAIGIVFGRSAAEQDDLDPVRLMPDTHKVIFENSFVRVVEGRVPAGGREIKHRHPHNVMVFLADFDVEIKTFPDDKWTPTHRIFGTVTWNEASTHEVKIRANAPSHTIRVELKC